MAVSIVTGGRGFLGRHVVARLLSEGRRVLVVDDCSTPAPPFGPEGVIPGEFLQIVNADLTTLGPIRSVGHQTAWDMTVTADEVWHLASPASPPLYKRIPIKTLRLGGSVLDDLLELMNDNGGRLLFASSSEVYGDPETEVQDESQPSRIHPTGPRSMYDAAKVYGEALCAAWTTERGTKTRIARIFNTFGPGQLPEDGRLVPAMVGAAVRGTEFRVHGSGLQTRTFGYVDDTVDGLFRIMRDGRDAVPYNVGGIQTRSVLDLAVDVQRVVGPLRLVTGDPDQDQHDPRRRRPDLGRLRSLGWQPTVDLHTGLARTADYIRGITKD